ncbi:MAG: sugar phosphate isomerase/epimerase family protein [Flexilinea sp.]
MKKKITICSAQFGDLPLNELCRLMHGIGYEGLELACQSHIDVDKVVSSTSYREEFQAVLNQYEMKIGAISAHLMGQCIGDRYDSRLDYFAPNKYAGKPEEIRKWAIDGMKTTAHAAQTLGVDIVTCFLGSPIWAFWYSFPQTTPQMVDDGFNRIKELWTPIFDEYDHCGVKLALEVHPTEIAFDYYSTKRLLETIDYRPTLGINFDPSHLKWQGVDPQIFLHDFANRIYHVHMKDVKLSKDPRTGILGSHIEFGDSRRGWDFVSLGHGDVDFDGIIRELNQIGYQGPLCVEWEDSGMERMFGAVEAYNYIKQLNFEPSTFGFDSAMKFD